jgi:hypothetical protein
VTNYPWYGAFAAAVMCVLVGATLIARSWALRSRGRHRAPRRVLSVPRVDERPESVELEYCATEQRPMEHGALPCGALVCLGCGRVTEVV